MAPGGGGSFLTDSGRARYPVKGLHPEEWRGRQNSWRENFVPNGVILVYWLRSVPKV